MKQFYQSLPERTDRVGRLMEYQRRVDISGHHKTVVNMLADRDYANSSFMIRRGMYVRKVLESMPPRIYPEELIVGSVMGVEPYAITETYEERRQWADISLAFPSRNTVWGTQDYCAENRTLSEEELHDEQRGRWSWGHSCYGLEKILKTGYAGMAEDAEARVREMKASHAPDREKLEFWESVSMCCRAVAGFSARYADALDQMAREETDPVRRGELAGIAAAARQAPAYPARTFREAIQGAWFSFMCHLLFNGTDMGRFDQIVYPYYAADVAKGVLTADQAQELLDCLWVKIAEWQRVHPGGHGYHPSMMLAGVDAEGRDRTNEVTYMCLTATRHLNVPTPKLSLRVNDQTPDALFELAHKMLSSGLMIPDFYNENAVIAAYGKIGVPFEDAIAFSQSVCEEISLAGISEECTNEGPHVDMHDMVMSALRKADGSAPFESILDQVDGEIARKVASEVDFHNRQTEKLARYLPQPLHSATIQGCVESGRDILRGGAKYNNTGSVVSGIATAANSLYAVKRLVYDEGRMSLADLLAVLAADYEGAELLRTEILSKFPKYGNDVEEVDRYAVRLFRTFCDELGKYRNSRGGVFKIGAWASEYRSNYPATPDGRKRWDSFAVNVSPTPGTDQKGATAVIRSTTKLGLDCCTAGGMVDVTLSPACLKGENGPLVLKQLVKAYCALGGCGLQFNFVDSAMLESARKDPLKYKNLMVRVWGYNDYFVALPADMQKHILDRTRHEEGL